MNKSLRRILAFVNLLSGSTIIFSIFYPIVADNLSAPPFLVSPLVEETDSASNVASSKPSTWFSDSQYAQRSSANVIKYYTIDIPRLRIDGATVAVGSENLDNSLIQYPGTALPGKIGNNVIFGHSVLPIFFNPKNYKTIFSTLPTMKIGDEIFVDYDGITYRYIVETKFEVKPNQIEVLEQPKDGSYLSLITCVPPGDPRKPRRLVVRARLVS